MILREDGISKYCDSTISPAKLAFSASASNQKTSTHSNSSIRAASAVEILKHHVQLKPVSYAPTHLLIFLIISSEWKWGQLVYLWQVQANYSCFCPWLALLHRWFIHFHMCAQNCTKGYPSTMPLCVAISMCCMSNYMGLTRRWFGFLWKFCSSQFQRFSSQSSSKKNKALGVNAKFPDNRIF